MASPLQRYLRAFGPSVLLAAGSGLAYLKLRSALQPTLIAPVLETMAWLPLAGYAFATGWALMTATRLWRWEAGTGPTCPHCGGFQGVVRPKRYGRADFGTCFDCGRHAAEDQ